MTALIPDLLFGSKVVAMLEEAGHEVELCSAEEQARGAVTGADVLIVDLVSDQIDGATLVDSMLSGGELSGVRTLAFYSHVDAAARARAEEVGFDVVVPRSRMAREGAELVAGIAGPSS